MLTGISWQEAQSRLLAWVQPLGTDQVRLRHAMSHFVDSPILGGAPYPAYNLATERGYALNYDALQNCWQRGESAKFIHGGHLGGARSFERRVEASHAYSVDAGTLLPDALDLVVTEAEVVRDGGEVVVRSRPPRHQNVFARGRFVPPGEVLLPEGHRIGYPAYTTLYSQPQLKEVRVLRKSTVGSLIIGAGLHDAQEENPPEGACRELLSPLLTGLSARWQFPFISLGVQPAHRSLADTVNAACDQIDLLVCTGLLSSSHLAELEAVIRDHCELRVRGLNHPLAGGFLAAERGGKWLFFLPYHPPMIHALVALIVFPFITRMMGSRHGFVPFVSAVNQESVRVEEPQDDIWVGEERYGREFMSVVEVRLLRQISRATLTTLTHGTCLAIPRTAGETIEAGSPLAIIRY